VVLHHVAWQDYIAIGDALRDRPALRLTYDRGTLEIMTTSNEHEWYKKRLGRFLETIAEECNRPIVPAGNMTFQREDLVRGFEPDECFWIAHEPVMRTRLHYDPQRDPPPDLTIEIEVTRSALNRMALFAAYGVPEVWRYDGATIHVHLLQPDGTYAPAERSPTFPAIPVAEIARFLAPDPNQDYLSVVRAFRAWVRERLANP
jgi:Uma2 family endonuclease